MTAPMNSNGHASHLLLVDIGNSRVALATWQDGRRNEASHLPADPIEPLAARLDELWNTLSSGANRAVVIGSVCPPLLDRLRGELDARRIGPVLVIGRDLAPPIPADVAEPDKVGTDRLCVAAAAYDGVKGACVVADFGTALTIDLVADNGVFLGGTILPGMALSARALHEHTALLPLVELGPTSQTLGKDTRSAIRNGIFAMMTGALREITERYATEINKWPPLILTGGDARMIAEACDFVDRVVPDLCLDGLALAYLRHTRQIQDG